MDDYFSKLQRSKDTKPPRALPTLSGDLFNYRYGLENSYWTGYFHLRPFLKHMGRWAEQRWRAAEAAFATAYSMQVVREPALNLDVFESLVSVRRHVALFQHHDAITGTATETVILDYLSRSVIAVL